MSTALAIRHDDITGLETFTESSDLVIPKIKIINISSGNITPDMVAKHRGKFFIQQTNEIFETMDVVFIQLKRGSMYNDTATFPNNLLCYTSNFFTPNAEPPMSPVCREVVVKNGSKDIRAVCPYAMFTEDERTKKKKAPACKEYWKFLLCHVKNDNTPSMVCDLTVRGMNVYGGSPIRKFVSSVKTSGKDFYCFKTTLKTVNGAQLYPNVSRSDQAFIVVCDGLNYMHDHEEYKEMALNWSRQPHVSSEEDGETNPSEAEIY